jgi:hypothetical protein
LPCDGGRHRSEVGRSWGPLRDSNVALLNVNSAMRERTANRESSAT